MSKRSRQYDAMVMELLKSSEENKLDSKKYNSQEWLFVLTDLIESNPPLMRGKVLRDSSGTPVSVVVLDPKLTPAGRQAIRDCRSKRFGWIKSAFRSCKTSTVAIILGIIGSIIAAVLYEKYHNQPTPTPTKEAEHEHIRK